MCLPPGCGPGFSLSLGRRSGSQRHTVEHIADPVPVVPLLHDVEPQTVEQLPYTLRFFDTLMPDPEQVIEVPKILPEDISVRAVLRDSQLAEQLVEGPTNPGLRSCRRCCPNHLVEDSSGADRAVRRHSSWWRQPGRFSWSSPGEGHGRL